ncbi:MAG: hypothetical protein WC476_12985 [Phycisphaerae bacterium]|jgi:hypothetical protein
MKVKCNNCDNTTDAVSGHFFEDGNFFCATCYDTYNNALNEITDTPSIPNPLAINAYIASMTSFKQKEVTEPAPAKLGGITIEQTKACESASIWNKTPTMGEDIMAGHTPAKHTPGKVDISSSVFLVSENTKMLANFIPAMGVDSISIPFEEAVANAERVKLMWNTYEDLLEALTLRRIADGYNTSQNTDKNTEILTQLESRCRKLGYKGLESGDGIFLYEFIDGICDAAIAKAEVK